jgi:hypothetical protein
VTESHTDTSIVAKHSRNIFIASLLGAAIFAVATLAAATPLTPPPGAIVKTSHPDFTWMLPSNEQSEAIFIADKPDVTPEGKFHDENFVDGDLVAADVREWSPSRPLYAGRYWWNVVSTDRGTLARSYSAPAEFTIPVALRLYGVKAKRFSFPRRRLWVDVRASANVKRPLVRVRLLHGRRVVWKSAHRVFGNIIPGGFDFYWYPQRRVKQGTRLRLIASISSGGVMRTRSILVRAP